MTNIKKTAEELAEKYSIAPLSQQDKDSVIRFKGDNLKITQEIQRLAFLAGFKARDEEVKQLKELLGECEKLKNRIKELEIISN